MTLHIMSAINTLFTIKKWIKCVFVGYLSLIYNQPFPKNFFWCIELYDEKHHHEMILQLIDQSFI